MAFPSLSLSSFLVIFGGMPTYSDSDDEEERYEEFDGEGEDFDEEVRRGGRGKNMFCRGRGEVSWARRAPRSVLVASTDATGWRACPPCRPLVPPPCLPRSPSPLTN